MRRVYETNCCIFYLNVSNRMKSIIMNKLRKCTIISSIAFLLLMAGCGGEHTEQNTVKKINVETPISAIYETRALPKDTPRGFDADDPAIWVHPKNPELSFVVGTLKEGGMDVYSLDGSLTQYVPPAPAPQCSDNIATVDCENSAGRWNNADVVYGFQTINGTEDLIVVSDRGTDKVDIFKVDQNNLGTDQENVLMNISASNIPRIFTSSQAEVNEGRTAYGLGVSDSESNLVFVSQNATSNVAILSLKDEANGTIGYDIAHVLDFPGEFLLPNGDTWKPCSDDDSEFPHFEGIVVDQYHSSVYLAQEDVGVWKISLKEPQNKNLWRLIRKVQSYGVPYQRTWSDLEEEFICEINYAFDPGFGDKELTADVEGLTLYDAGNGAGYILLSSQGSNQYVVYSRGNDVYLGSFEIEEGKLDGVSETDGMMVTAANLGGVFRQGLLVVQDGSNEPSISGETTNFKYVQWDDIQSKIDNMNN